MIDDRDELDAAYREGEFTEDEYKAALLEDDKIINEWAKDINASKQLCKEILMYVKAYAGTHPLTVFLDVDGVLNIYQPDREVQTLLPYAIENI